MTHTLFLGERRYSSWSLRAWLACRAAGLAFREVPVALYGDGRAPLEQQLAAVAPARTVPVLLTSEGAPLRDTLAIAETLAERCPDAGLWPADPVARGHARSMVAEMHAGFAALRNECPMNLGAAWSGYAPSSAVRADLDRLAELWDAAPGETGGWLCGGYGLADIFFAPVAARVATYDLPLPPPAAEYVARQLAHPAFVEWRRAALAEPQPDPVPHRPGLPERPWPGPR